MCVYVSTSTSQSLLSTSLDRQQNHGDKRGKEETASGVDGRVGVGVAAVDGDDGGHQAADAVEERGDAGAGTTVGRGEHLGCVRVEHAVHDVLEEGLERRTHQLRVGVGGDREAEQDDARDQRRERHRALASDVLHIHRVAREERPRNSDNRRNRVVAVRDVHWRRAAGSPRVG